MTWLYTDTDDILRMKERNLNKEQLVRWSLRAGDRKPANLENLEPMDKLVVIGEGWKLVGEIEFIRLDEVLDDEYPYHFYYKITKISKKKPKLDNPQIREKLLELEFLKSKDAVLFPYLRNTIRRCSEEVFEYLQSLI